MGYLLAKIPWQNENNIGSVVTDPMLSDDWDVATREILPLLHWIVVNYIRHEVRTHAGVVQQRVALCRSAVTNYAAAVFLGSKEKPM